MKITKQIILDVIVFLLMLLFIYAAVFKLLDFKNFTQYIGIYSVFGEYISGTMAIAIPLTELCVAALLFMPRFRLLGLYASLVLMLGFTAYIGYYTLLNITKRPCACGGILNSMGWTEHFIFNIAFSLMAAAGILLKIREGRQKYDPSVSY
jgi:hypothetical protein